VKRLIVIGKHGQLARAIARQARLYDFDIVGAYDIEDCDLAGPAQDIEKFANDLPQADGLIMAAAYTAVDKAQSEPDIARRVNATAPGIFAKVCHARKMPIVHISTDYVFPGTGNRPYKPDDPTGPINVYGITKLAGELEVVRSGARAAILRTGWVFDGSGKNFLTTMLRLAETRDNISVVDDQIGRPTYAGHLANACLVAMAKLVNEPLFSGGIYHVSGAGEPVSWAGFAQAIFAQASGQLAHGMTVEPIPSSDYPTAAKRPAFSVLDMSGFDRVFDYEMPNWKTGLEAAIL